MTEAAKAALAYAFEEEKLQMVSVFHFPFNGRSRRVIEKCGFRREGFLRMATCQYNGKILDEVCYSLTADEYWAERMQKRNDNCRLLRCSGVLCRGSRPLLFWRNRLLVQAASFGNAFDGSGTEKQTGQSCPLKTAPPGLFRRYMTCWDVWLLYCRGTIRPGEPLPAYPSRRDNGRYPGGHLP